MSWCCKDTQMYCHSYCCIRHIYIYIIIYSYVSIYIYIHVYSTVYMYVLCIYIYIYSYIYIIYIMYLHYIHIFVQYIICVIVCMDVALRIQKAPSACTGISWSYQALGCGSEASAMGALRQSSSFSYLWHLYLWPKLGGVPKMEGEPKKCYSVDSHQVFPVGLDLLFLLLVGWVGGWWWWCQPWNIGAMVGDQIEDQKQVSVHVDTTVIDWFGKSIIVKTARISTCCPAFNMLHPKCPRHTKKKYDILPPRKTHQKVPPKNTNPNPKIPKPCKKIPKYTQQNPKVPHTKKNIPKPLASSLCPGAPRASSPRPDRKHRSAAAAWYGGRSLKNPLAPKLHFLRAHVDRKQLRNCNSY